MSDKRQKNQNSRGMNFPYIQFPAANSNVPPAKSESEESITPEDTDVSEEAEAPESKVVPEDTIVSEEITESEEMSEEDDVPEEKNVFEEEDVPEEAAASAPEKPETEDSRDTAADIRKTEVQAASIESAKKDNFYEEDIGEIPSIDGLYGRGLFHYKKWWYRCKVEISVNGELISGIPIFSDHYTLRVVNQKHSYFIPVEKIDYIRTSDGLIC